MAKSSLIDGVDTFPESERAKKRIKLLSDAEDSDASDSDSDGGVKVSDSKGFSINQEYARRFEHNSKRAELHRLEEKYGKVGQGQINGNDIEEDSDSTSSSEDDDGALASGALEADFNATLQAIKNKDPRIYKQEEKFYNSDDEVIDAPKSKAEKPVFLSDYHRQNLLNGDAATEIENPMPSYDQEQNELRKRVVKEMHAAEEESSDGDGSGQDNMFTVKRRLTLPVRDVALTSTDVEQANQDPENFLSKFLESRAWAAGSASANHAFESDDEEEDRKAEQFEEAYNLRFENSNGVNEKLTSHARDTAAKYSVRDQPKSQRQRARDVEKAKKDAVKAERAKEIAQLKKLRMEEMGHKLEKIQEAAGSRKKEVNLEEWSEFLADDWDDDKWEDQMKSRFNEAYYAEADAGPSDGETNDGKKKKSSRPKWDDDIDIGDIIPDFEKDDEQFSLSDADDDNIPTSDKKQNKMELEKQKKEARKNKRKLEQLAEEKVNEEVMMGQVGKNTNTRFRYRDTSPVAWGLSSRDILMASDAQLNQFAGLKKLASFREAGKRKKDKKTLGKKARLREWRKETFGNVDGPQKTIQDVMMEAQQDDGGIVNAREHHVGSDKAVNGGGKRKRSKKNK